MKDLLRGRWVVSDREEQREVDEKQSVCGIRVGMYEVDDR